MIGVKGPFPSKGLPVVRARFGKSMSKGNKSLDSIKSDDSLTSLEWLSTMGNPTAPVIHAVYPAEASQNYNIQDLISLAFRLARKQVLSLGEIADMALRLAPHLTQDHVFRELSSNNQFVTSKNGWRLASAYQPSEAKKRRIESEIVKRKPRQRKQVPIELPQIPQSHTVDIVINNNNPLSQHGCPDLSELLNEIGLPEDTVTGNPFLQANNKSQEMTFQTSIAASLPGLEVTGERISPPKNWTARDECAEIIVQNEYDVETPYMVESWLKDTFLDFTS